MSQCVRQRLWITAAMLATFLSGAWIYGYHYHAFARSGAWTTGISRGCWFITHTTNGAWARTAGFTRNSPGWVLLPSTSYRGQSRAVSIPLWMPTLATLGLAIYWHRQARRHAHPSLCAACGYDRAGLGGGVPCPECGAPDGGPGGDDTPSTGPS